MTFRYLEIQSLLVKFQFISIYYIFNSTITFKTFIMPITSGAEDTSSFVGFFGQNLLAF